MPLVTNLTEKQLDIYCESSEFIIELLSRFKTEKPAKVLEIVVSVIEDIVEDLETEGGL
jgi:hypothetical protein